VKLVHLVGFITKKFVTLHGHMNVKFAFQHTDNRSPEDGIRTETWMQVFWPSWREFHVFVKCSLRWRYTSELT